jgi:hypothetical protein
MFLLKTAALVLAVLSSQPIPVANTAGAQVRPMFTKRLRSPASVQGFIGGESHDRYVIRVRKGQVLAVQLSWRRKNDNRAEFGVTQTSDREPVKFGVESDGGKRWTGKVLKSGDYYIYVVAHPTAHYTLKIAVK